MLFSLSSANGRSSFLEVRHRDFFVLRLVGGGSRPPPIHRDRDCGRKRGNKSRPAPSGCVSGFASAGILIVVVIRFLSICLSVHLCLVGFSFLLVSLLHRLGAIPVRIFIHLLRSSVGFYAGRCFRSVWAVVWRILVGASSRVLGSERFPHRAMIYRIAYQ